MAEWKADPMVQRFADILGLLGLTFAGLSIAAFVLMVVLQ